MVTKRRRAQGVPIRLPRQTWIHDAHGIDYSSALAHSMSLTLPGDYDPDHSVEAITELIHDVESGTRVCRVYLYGGVTDRLEVEMPPHSSTCLFVHLATRSIPKSARTNLHMFLELDDRFRTRNSDMVSNVRLWIDALRRCDADDADRLWRDISDSLTLPSFRSGYDLELAEIRRLLSRTFFECSSFDMPNNLVDHIAGRVLELTRPKCPRSISNWSYGASTMGLIIVYGNLMTWEPSPSWTRNDVNKEQDTAEKRRHFWEEWLLRLLSSDQGDISQHSLIRLTRHYGLCCKAYPPHMDVELSETSLERWMWVPRDYNGLSSYYMHRALVFRFLFFWATKKVPSYERLATAFYTERRQYVADDDETRRLLKKKLFAKMSFEEIHSMFTSPKPPMIDGLFFALSSQYKVYMADDVVN